MASSSLRLEVSICPRHLKLLTFFKAMPLRLIFGKSLVSLTSKTTLRSISLTNRHIAYKQMLSALFITIGINMIFIISSGKYEYPIQRLKSIHNRLDML